MSEKNKDRYEIDFVGLKFSSPLVGSSGTVGFGVDLKNIADIRYFGGMSLKTLTLCPREGNPFPRVCETEVGLLNAIGLQNEGWDVFVKKYLPLIKKMPQKKIVSLAGDTVKDFALLAQKASLVEGIDVLELNISCPNVDYGGSCYAADNGLLRELLQECATVTNGKKPLMLKLSPHVSSIKDVVRLAENNQIKALSMANTVRGLKIDINTRQPLISRVVGGYSGMPIKPIALAMVYEAKKWTNLPILGIGGVMCGDDVVEYMLAGATLVGVGTANFVDPSANKKIFKQFARYLDKNQLKAKDLVGALSLPK